MRFRPITRGHFGLRLERGWNLGMTSHLDASHRSAPRTDPWTHTRDRDVRHEPRPRGRSRARHRLRAPWRRGRARRARPRRPRLGRGAPRSRRFPARRARAARVRGFRRRGPADAAPTQKYYSGMEGKALNADQKQFPSMAEVLSKIPKHCFVKDTARSMMYAAVSTALTLGCGVLAYLYLPLQLAYLPAWIAYAFVAGTCATGCWVVAHECGHGAFSDNKVFRTPSGTSCTPSSSCRTSPGRGRTRCTTAARTTSWRGRRMSPRASTRKTRTSCSSYETCSAKGRSPP